MIRLTALALASSMLLATAPAFAQTQASCPTGGSGSSQPVWVLFDLGSAVVRPADKPKIAEAVATAKNRQAAKVCLVGQTDKLGDKALNEKLALARSRAVAAEMIRVGYPGDKIIIATNPEAFGDSLNLGSRDAQEKDRRVTIVFR
jgi:outer membrane protein OmpA-like peptidoglycan-associated protein